MSRNPKRLGAYCARCGCTYLTPDWPGPGVCAKCNTGILDYHHDLPIGSVCVTS